MSSFAAASGLSNFGPLFQNLLFMISEVSAQVEQTHGFFQEPSRAMVEKINARDDYIDTLKSLIEEKTFDRLIHGGVVNRQQSNLLRSLNTIASNLERIADFAENILGQAQFLTDLSYLSRYNYSPFFQEVQVGLDSIADALEKYDVGVAYRICQCEFNLDALYKDIFGGLLNQLRTGRETGNLITTLFIFRYLERMGDSLLNIGEAIIFALVGEKLKIQQYQALSESLASSGIKAPINEVELQSIWGTRSGCRIGTAQNKAASTPASARPVLFKHGNAKKLKTELDNLGRWQAFSPGLVPEVLSFHTDDHEGASILLEYLSGCNLQELVLSADSRAVLDALFYLEETAGGLWEQTLKHEPVEAGFMAQAIKRQDTVYRVHPDFDTAPLGIGNLSLPATRVRLNELRTLDQDLPAPFSVLIHGDFNLNNVIWDSRDERIHYVDLNRSNQSDYVQDVSVFLASNFRLPIFDEQLRGRINQVIQDFLTFADGFAAKHDDRTFEARLALGLARSFFTSTRFEFNDKFAKQMFQRSMYLLGKLASHRGRDWTEFKLPTDILIL
jgi:phosphate uptake regulator